MVKLFTHASDPDGLGCVILAKLMDEHLDFTLCKGVRELNTYLDFFLRTDQAKNYDQIYITDLCPSNVLLQRIDQDEVLKAKFRILILIRRPLILYLKTILLFRLLQKKMVFLVAARVSFMDIC